MKKAIKILVLLVVLGGAGYFGYQYYQSTKVEAVASAPEYTMATIQKGTLSQSVTGTGTLSIGETKDVTLDYAITVTGTIVEAGDVVDEGAAILNVDKDTLGTTITSLQEELDTCESEMSSLSASYSSTTYVKMPLDGRVKEVYMEVGQKMEDVMAEKGAIALLSLDGKMYVEVDAPEGMAVTDQVTVRSGRTDMVGTVREVSAGKAKITFTDATVGYGQEVEVIYNKQSLGTAIADINMPYALTTTEKGYIYSVYLEKNDKKWEGNRVAYLINVPVSDEYKTLENTRQKLTEKLAAAKAMLENGTVASPINGIVSSISDPSQEEVTAGTSLATLYVGDKKQMIVSVDELDITNVEVGQEVDIVMDALPTKTYSATVSHVSQIGTSESGVTVYSVTLAIDGDDQLKIGMNGTATIKIQEVKDTLLVPITALNTSRDGQYVWVYDENKAEDSDEPGVKTFIETGMSDENYAQVVSGLNEGDVVLITRTASTTTNSFGGGQGNMMIMDFGGGSMPSGGTMPSGGGSMPSGGGGNRGN